MSQANDIIDDLRLLEPANPWLYATAAVVLVLLAWLSFSLWRRRCRQTAVATSATNASTQEDAMAELEKIRALILPGNSLAYGRAVSGFVRRYIERRFGLLAPRRSTEEFLIEAASSRRLDAAHQKLLADFLSHCDFLKFGRGQAELDELEAIHASAVRFVMDTPENAIRKEVEP
jgi:hypothetical protein